MTLVSSDLPFQLYTEHDLDPDKSLCRREDFWQDEELETLTTDAKIYK